MSNEENEDLGIGQATDNVQVIDPNVAALSRLLKDLESQQRRLKKVDDPSIKSIQTEVSGTVLGLVKDTIQSVLQVAHEQFKVRALYEWATGITNHLDGLEVRIQNLEDYGGGSNILPDDYDLFSRVMVSAETLAQERLGGQVVPLDDAGVAKMREVLDLCNQMKDRLADALVEFDEDEEFEDEEFEDDNENEETNG